MQQNSITSLGRAELAQKYFPFIQPQSAWLKLKSLMAEDPCLAPLTRLKRRTFLPSEVAKIYASLGHPWPPGPPPLWGGRERSSPLWPPGPPPLWGGRERSPLWRRAKETTIFIRRNFHFPAMKQTVCLALHFRHTPGSRYWKRHTYQNYKVTKLQSYTTEFYFCHLVSGNKMAIYYIYIIYIIIYII